MIVKNEERYLRGCLESAKPFVDEIIVVDTGSTDKTVEIAKEFEANVIPFQWTGNFSEARNESLQHATGSWILYLDADERLVEGYQLRALVKNSKHWAYTLRIRGKHHLPSGIVEQVNAYPRLFRRHPKIFFEGVVHEQILPSIRKLGKSVGESSVMIEHLGYGESLESVREKCKRNAFLLERQLTTNPHDDYARYQLANTYVVMQEYAKAEPELRALVTSNNIDNSIKASAANLLVEVTLHRNAIGEAEFWCLQSLKFVGNQTMARWFLSGILAHSEKYEEALQALHKLQNEASSTSSFTGLSHDLVLSSQQIEERMLYCYDMLSLNAVKKGNLDEAEHWIDEAETFGLRSYVLQRRGLELSLAKKDVATAYARLEFIVNNLPAEALEQRAKFLAIKEKLAKLAA